MYTKISSYILPSSEKFGKNYNIAVFEKYIVIVQIKLIMYLVT